MATYVALIKVIVEADNEEDATSMLEEAITMVEDADLGQNVSFVVENDLVEVD
jgi:hypothetical protein